MMELQTDLSDAKLGEKIVDVKQKLDHEVDKIVSVLKNKYDYKALNSMLTDTSYGLKVTINKCTSLLNSLELSVNQTADEVSDISTTPIKKYKEIESIIKNLEEIRQLEETYSKVNNELLDRNYNVASELIDNSLDIIKSLSKSKDVRILQLAELLTVDYSIKKEELVREVKIETKIENNDENVQPETDDKSDKILLECSLICDKVRQLAMKECVEEVEVGYVNDNDIDDSVKSYFNDIEMRFSIKQEKNSEYELPKLLQLRKCKITKTTKEFTDLIIETINKVVSTEDQSTSGKLLTTVYNCVKIFIFTFTKEHDEILKSVPLFGALFYNGCYYIAHIILLECLKLQPKLDESILSCVNLHKLIPELRDIAAKILEIHLLHLRRQISSLIGPDDLFANLMNDGSDSDYKKTIKSCLNLICQVAGLWKPIFSEFVYLRSIGSLISYTLAVLIDVICSKEDITEKDSKEIVNQLNDLLLGFENIMIFNNEPKIQQFCEKDYYRTKEVIFCLNEPLLSIADRWCNGKGPLAYWMKSDEVKKLIRAIFQNTDLRSKILSQIN